MNLFGYELTLRKKALSELSSVGYTSGSTWGRWFGLVHEPFAGAWQRNITADPASSILANSAVFACITGIASDIGKMRMKLSRNEGGIWVEITENQPWLPVLRRPNHYQNRIQFLEAWVISKLEHGNTYILKERADRRGIVTALYPLDPTRTTPLVADNGDVYYRLQPDTLSRTDGDLSVSDDDIVVPASEIIHDRMYCLWHPLIGVPPLYACALSATLGNRIQQNSTTLFGNGAMPAGIIYTATRVDDAQAQKLKEKWETGYSGANVGKVAILGDGLKYEPMAMSGTDAQLIEQLKWTIEDIARAFHYPMWKLGGPVPPYSNGPDAITTQYYTDCLHSLIEKIELGLDEGLELPGGIGTELDLENLLRMDTAALFTSNNTAVGGGWMSPNEARYRANLKPVDGGEAPMMQQQNWTLAQLHERTGPEDRADVAAPPEEPEPEKVEARALTAADLDFFETEFEKELVLQ